MNKHITYWRCNCKQRGCV